MKGRVVLYSRNTFFYTSRSILIPYSELILSVNIVRVKMIRSHRNVLERRCRPEAFQCKLSGAQEGRERERERERERNEVPNWIAGTHSIDTAVFDRKIT